MKKNSMKVLSGWDVWIAERSKESFIKNFMRLFNQMHRSGLNAVTIWGFLDDKHGGVDSGRELIEYARKKQVLLCPGIGVYCYGGLWCRGSHRYNLETYLDKYPERIANREVPPACIHPLHTRVISACPSSEENRKWMLEGIRWFMRALRPDAVYTETGDYGACGCEKCKPLAGGLLFGKEENYSVAGRIKMQLPIWEEAHKINPGITVFWATYTNYNHLTRNDLRWIKRIPDYVYTIWTVAWFYFEKIDLRTNLPEGKHIAYAPIIGSTHFDLPYTPLYPHYAPHLFQPQLNRIRLLAEALRKERWNGLLIPMSGLADRVDNEINYNVLGKFSGNSDFDNFVRKELDGLFGKGSGKEMLPILLEIEKPIKTLNAYYFWFRSFYGVPESEMGNCFPKQLPAESAKTDKGDWEDASSPTRLTRKSVNEAITDWKNIAVQLRRFQGELETCKNAASVKGKSRMGQIQEWLNEQILLVTYVYPGFVEIQSRRELACKYLEELKKEITADLSLRDLRTATMKVDANEFP